MARNDVEIQWGADVDDIRQAGRDIDDVLENSRFDIAKWGKDWQFTMLQAGEVVADMAAQAARALAAFAAEGIQHLGAIETQMVRIGALGGTTAKELGAITDWARDFAIQTGYAAEETLLIVEELKSLQFETGMAQNIIDASAALTDLAGGATDLRSVAGGLAVLMNDVGEQFRDAGDAADFMRQNVNLGKMTQDELNRALVELVPIANSAGVNMEELGGLLTTVTAHSMQLVRATPQLRNAMIILAGDEATKKAQKEGIKLTGDVVDKIRQLADATRDMTTGRRTSLFEDMFGRESVTAMMTITSNIEDFNRNLEEMGNRAGASTQGLEEARNSIEKVRAVTEASITELSMLFGDIFVDDLLRAQKSLGALTVIVRENADGIKEGARQVVAFAGNMVDAIPVVGKVTGALDIFRKATEKLIESQRTQEDLAPVISEGIRQQEDAYAEAIEILEQYGEDYTSITGETFEETKRLRIEHAESIKKIEDDIDATLERAVVAAEERAEAEAKVLEKRQQAYANLETNLISSLMKEQQAQEELYQEAQKENAKATDDFSDSLRRMNVQLAAARMEQERATGADKERVRHIDILGNAVSDLGRMGGGVARAADMPATAAAPTAPPPMIDALRQILPTLTGEERGMVQPILNELQQLGTEESMMGQLELVENIERLRDRQTEIRDSQNTTTTALDGVLEQMAKLADSPESFAQILEMFKATLADINTVIAAERAEIDQLRQALLSEGGMLTGK